MVCNRLGVDVEARVISKIFQFQLIDEGLALGVLKVLDFAVVSVLRFWSRLGDAGDGNVSLGFSQAVDEDLHYETQE